MQHHLYADQRVGADPHLVPHHMWLQWEADLSNRLLNLAKINTNIVDLIWAQHRPQCDQVTVKVQSPQYAGEKWEDKVTHLRTELIKHKCDGMIVTSLTEIAYLLNIRGRDIPFTPVVKVGAKYLLTIYKYVIKKLLFLGLFDCHS